MKRCKWLSVGAIALLFCINEMVLAQESQSRYVKPETENLRATPNGRKVGTLMRGTELKVIDRKGKWIKVEVTGWIFEPSTTANKNEIKKVIKKSNLVEFVNSRVESLPADFSRDSKPYGAHVRAYFQFRNNSKKTLTGLVYETTFLDSFGDVLYKTTMKDQLKIPPGKTNRMSSFWYWEDNEFIDGQPYDKLQSAAGAGTIKVKVKIKKAVFEDGTVVNF